MKKLYNKALMYQFFYLGKWALLVSVILYGIFTYSLVNNNLVYLRSKISLYSENPFFGSNTLDNLNSYYVIWLYLIIFLLYIVVTGFNKRNNMTFLTSGPYSKEEIKKNEILFLMICLFLIVFTFIYINICLYVRDNSLLSLASNEYTALFVKYNTINNSRNSLYSLFNIYGHVIFKYNNKYFSHDRNSNYISSYIVVNNKLYR